MSNNQTIPADYGPRITPLEPPYSEELQRSFDVVMPPGVPPLNIFRTVGRNPRVLSRMVRGGLLDRGSISVADRELVILRACAVCKADYEWGVHAAIFADQTGFTSEQVADTRADSIDSNLWTREQLLLMRMVDSLHNSSQLDDELWHYLHAVYTEEQLVELVMLAGLYHAVSFVVNAFRVEAESFAA